MIRNKLAYLGDRKLKVPRAWRHAHPSAYIRDLDDPESEINKVIAENRVTQLEPLEGTETTVIHLNIPTVFLAGTVYYPKDMEEVSYAPK
jgi:hypothetical protein